MQTSNLKILMISSDRNILIPDSSVGERMKEYANLGIETFILSGYPHLEEAYQVADLLFPLLPINNSAPILKGQSGEIVGNTYFREKI